MHTHPQPDDQGHPVFIHHPHMPSPPETWLDPTTLATFVPEGAFPGILNGIHLASWTNTPKSHAGWAKLAYGFDFPEPAFDPKGLKASAGAAVLESDGRVWLVAPSNAFGGYKATFPKGKTDGQELRATAIKEVFEETGLQVELLAHLVDVRRSTSMARYYLARRVGGCPAAMGWESQAVHLAPLSDLKTLLHHPNDQPILEALVEALVKVLPSLTHA
jgi:8-oxo-dGTP pyrophosphatase MutT (NUDIX family)